jgi:hypothetical protein
MSWLVWRQYRVQGAIALALLAGFGAVLIVTGAQMASQWHSGLASCAASGTCAKLAQTLSLGSPLGRDFVLLSNLVPALLGFLWGAPLVAGEVEAGTRVYAWTQGISRTRWLLVKAGWLLLAAAAWGGAVTALTTWWYGPRNALYASAFQPNTFDTQGIVTIGYSVFALALGVAAGALTRRTLPAIAITIGGFIGMRLLISEVVRQHYLTAVTAFYNPLQAFAPPGPAWTLQQGVMDKYGQVFTGRNGPEVNGVPFSALPANCQKFSMIDPGTMTKTSLHAAVTCMQASGFRGFVTYQPASRWWAFQGIETGIFLALAAALIAAALVVVRRRDA